MQRAVQTNSLQERSDILPLAAERLGYARGGRALVSGVDLKLEQGLGSLVIMGPNGAGKSLLLRLLVGLVLPDVGCVLWAGRPPAQERAAKIGFVFQKPVLLRRSVRANVTYVLKAAHVPRDEREERAGSALSEAGLAHLADMPARLLSGGEQQRLSIARALAADPELLLLDEPTSSLDPASMAAIEKLLGKVRRRGTGIVLVTHDVAQARRLADEVVFMHRGRILERAPADRFWRSPQSSEARSYVNGEIVL